MRYIADLHIHSPFSRATSKSSHLHGLAAWAMVKGIQVVGTGDFTHPGWLDQIGENLEEAEPGFFRLRTDDPAAYADILPGGLTVDVSQVRFVLTAEISSIYKRSGQVRKVHNILFAPDLASVKRINATLAGIGNLVSDGRPILGLDSRDLLEILLENAPEGFLVPAHIWTPWFSLFGSKSGFNAIEECFGDLSDHIFALETGLSSDPDMNRMISALDRFTLISNSDCHSPGKLGREANILTTGFDYFSMRDALRAPADKEGKQLFDATIEFYPEEGKYHCDGHRKCGVSLEPLETKEVNGICPVCGRPLTVGVLYRVMELADRNKPVYPAGAPRVHSLVPLPELLGELLGVGPATKKVASAYSRLVRQFGSEFSILLETEISTLERESSPVLAEAVRRVRSGEVIRTAGYDGEFGVIKVFTEHERKSFGGQKDLFGPGQEPVKRKKNIRRRRLKVKDGAANDEPIIHKLNPEQAKIIASGAQHIIVKAGPGTGKTHSLVQRVISLAEQGRVPCTVITFTNRAVDELQQRISAVVKDDDRVSVTTLHGYCLRWLRRKDAALKVAGPEMRNWILRSEYTSASAEERRILNRKITGFLQSVQGPAGMIPSSLQPYFNRLNKIGQVDIDDVVPEVIRLLAQGGGDAGEIRSETGMLFVDEFQDLNKSQYELIRLLAEDIPVFVIGDPDQAIYGFRGSSPQWFFHFARDLDPEQHQLHRNYRNSSVIVEAACAVIGQNRHQFFPVKNESVTGQAGAVYVKKVSSPKDEARFVGEQIETLLGGTSHREIDRLKKAQVAGIALGDIAVLYRTGRQAEVLVEALSEHGFPVQVVDIEPYYVKKPILPLYLWTLFAADLGESSHLLTLLKDETGIGTSRLGEVEQLLYGTDENPITVLLQNRTRLSPEICQVLDDVTAMLEKMTDRAAEKGLVQALQLLTDKYDLDREADDVIRFFSLADTFGTSFRQLGDHLLRYSDTVVYDDRAEAVALMTLHASKGLEFKAVFIVGCEEDILPIAARSTLSTTQERDHLEEERRLFYVGMTRAQDVLFLSHAEKRTIRGKISEQLPSRFLQEIPSGILSSADTLKKGRNHQKPRVKQLSLFD